MFLENGVTYSPVKVTGFLFAAAFLYQWEYVRNSSVYFLFVNVYMYGRGAPRTRVCGGAVCGKRDREGVE